MKLTTTIGLLSLCLAACATDEGSNGSTSNRLSKAQTAALFNSALRGLDAGKDSSQGARLLAPEQTTVDATFACELGGHFDMLGTYEYSLDSDAETWDLDASFADCNMSEVTMDGELSWNHDTTTLGFTETLVGTLTVSTPELTTTCAFDVRIDSSASGDVYSGTICGYDASGVIADDPSDD
jgi:hypothetical protein